jgi:hypothetical protein
MVRTGKEPEELAYERVSICGIIDRLHWRHRIDFKPPNRSDPRMIMCPLCQVDLRELLVFQDASWNHRELVD